MTALLAKVSAWSAGISARPQLPVLVAFVFTIFTSALLLFLMQPMFAKIVLPKLGGSPSVWAVSMCFFQAVLLAGYCYAHALNRALAPRPAVIVHLALLAAVATLGLPVGLPADASNPPAGDAYLWLIGILAAGAGLPFFAISATAPLLQSWFARTRHEHAADPYFLYAASNAGSLIALLAYPVAVEPFIGLQTQSALWSVGFALFCIPIALCGLAMVRHADSSDGAAAVVATGRDRVAPTDVSLLWIRRAQWLAYSFVPSGLLVAFTTYITTDIASAPLLWVLPLSAYLLTFILVFRERPIIPHHILADRHVLVAAFALFTAAAVGSFQFGIGIIGATLGFVVTTLVVHRELYLRRPAAARLTEFYLWMSLGGVLGGIFAAIVAPQLFSTVFEFPLLIMAGLLLKPGLIGTRLSMATWRKPLQVFAAGLAVVAAVAVALGYGLTPAVDNIRLWLIAALIVVLMAVRHDLRSQIAVAALMLAVIAIVPDGKGALHTERSFFGVHRVLDGDDGRIRVLMHGTTVHGAERRLDASGQPAIKPVPLSYYYAGGPIARAVDLARTTTPAPLRAGVVGLGAGAMACASRTGESWRFFEIDQVVADIARRADYFRFLAQCQPAADIVVGDARLTLTGERSGSFDYLLIDAFSSDAIPTHLMTIEALSQFVDKLAARGVLVLHVSNRHLDLVPIVAAGVAALPGLHGIVIEDLPDAAGIDQAPSKVVVLSRRSEVLDPARQWPGYRLLTESSVEAWRDDYSDVVSALWRGLFR